MGSNKEVLTIDAEACKGCGYCVEYCPRQALYTTCEINAMGYSYVRADRDKCAACGICFNVCPDYVFEIVPEVGS